MLLPSPCSAAAATISPDGKIGKSWEDLEVCGVNGGLSELELFLVSMPVNETVGRLHTKLAPLPKAGFLVCHAWQLRACMQEVGGGSRQCVRRAYIHCAHEVPCGPFPSRLPSLSFGLLNPFCPTPAAQA